MRQRTVMNDLHSSTPSDVIQSTLFKNSPIKRGHDLNNFLFILVSMIVGIGPDKRFASELLRQTDCGNGQMMR